MADPGRVTWADDLPKPPKTEQPQQPILATEDEDDELSQLTITSNMSVILCTAGYDHTIRFWEALSGLCSRQIPHNDSQINRLCISPNKQFLAVAGRTKVHLYTCRESHRTPGASDTVPWLTFEGHTNNVTGVGFHCDTKWMVTSSEDGTVKIWDTKSGTIQRNYNHGCPVNDVVIHPNQGELISCDRGGNVRIWDLGENKCSHQLIPEEGVSVQSVTVASDGTMMCAGNNSGNVYVWRLKQLAETTVIVPICKFRAHNAFITRVLLSPDVRQLATCSADHTARIWRVSVKTDENDDGPDHEGFDPEEPAQASSSADAGPSNAASNSQDFPSMPESATPAVPFELEATLQEHQRWVWDCAFSADSAYLVTASSDHYARLWDLSEQKIIRQYQGHHRGLVCVALNDYSEVRAT